MSEHVRPSVEWLQSEAAQPEILADAIYSRAILELSKQLRRRKNNVARILANADDLMMNESVHEYNEQAPVQFDYGPVQPAPAPVPVQPGDGAS